LGRHQWKGKEKVPYLLALHQSAAICDMKATITSKGQITIPAKVRRRLNLRPGQILEFDEEAPYLKATRIFDSGEMYATIGCCKNKKAPARSSQE
jgi:AbrB family looped-hinge helix DNA binding protein